MNQFEYMPIVDEQKRSNLLKMSAESRRLNEAFPSDKPKAHSKLKLLVMIRKQLLYLRFTLQDRILERGEAHLASSMHSNPEGCR